jgi:hypothetical protein
MVLGESDVTVNLSLVHGRRSCLLLPRKRPERTPPGCIAIAKSRSPYQSAKRAGVHNQSRRKVAPPGF